MRREPHFLLFMPATEKTFAEVTIMKNHYIPAVLYGLGCAVCIAIGILGQISLFFTLAALCFSLSAMYIARARRESREQAASCSDQGRAADPGAGVQAGRIGRRR